VTAVPVRGTAVAFLAAHRWRTEGRRYNCRVNTGRPLPTRATDSGHRCVRAIQPCV